MSNLTPVNSTTSVIPRDVAVKQVTSSQVTKSVPNGGAKNIITPTSKPSVQPITTPQYRADLMKIIKLKCGVNLEDIDKLIGEIVAEFNLIQMSKDQSAILDKLSDPIMVSKMEKLVRKINTLKSSDMQCIINKTGNKEKVCKSFTDFNKLVDSEKIAKIIKISKIYSHIIKQLVNWEMEMLANVSENCGGDAKKIKDIRELIRILSSHVTNDAPQNVQTGIEKFDENLSEDYGENFVEGAEACVANSWGSCSMYGYSAISFCCCACCCLLIVLILIGYTYTKSAGIGM